MRESAENYKQSTIAAKFKSSSKKLSSALSCSGVETGTGGKFSGRLSFFS